MLKITVLILAFILIIIISQYNSYNNNEQYSNLNLSNNIDRLTDNITDLADNIVDNVNEITDNGDDTPGYGEPRTRSGYPVNDQIQQHENNLRIHIENDQHHGHRGQPVIGGCKGTQFGCCSDGVTPKHDPQGSNCNKQNCWLCNPGAGSKGICMPTNCGPNTYNTRVECDQHCGSTPPRPPPSPSNIPLPNCFTSSPLNDPTDNRTDNRTFCANCNMGAPIGVKSGNEKLCRIDNQKGCNKVCINKRNQPPNVCKHENNPCNTSCCEGWLYECGKSNINTPQKYFNIDSYNKACVRKPTKDDLKPHHGPDGPDVTPNKPIYRIKNCNKGKVCSADYVDVKDGLAPPKKTHPYAEDTQCCTTDPKNTTRNHYTSCPPIPEEDQKAWCNKKGYITHGYPYLGGLNTNRCYDANSCWKSYTDDENLGDWVTAESDPTFRKYLKLSN